MEFSTQHMWHAIAKWNGGYIISLQVVVTWVTAGIVRFVEDIGYAYIVFALLEISFRSYLGLYPCP